MQITELLGQYEEGNGTLFFLLARQFKSIPNTMRTAALVNTLSPSAHYFEAVQLISFRNQMQYGVSVMNPKHMGVVMGNSL